MNMSLEEPKKQCKFYVVRKKRNCRMHVKEGDEFCAEHLKPKDVEDVKEEDTKSRIVCPLDRTHTCYAHKLQKHLKICNARNTKDEIYIVRGINSGSNGKICDDSYKLLSTFSNSDILETIKKVNKVYEEQIKGNISEKILTHVLLEEEMSKPEYGDKTKKHLKQASSILGLLYEYNLVKPDTCYIEFGAGRGQLTYWICKSTEQQDGISLLLVEKASPKHKKDNKLAKTTDKVQRIRADISDLVLDKLDVISKTQHIVGVTKHLCGGATDLAIRCLTNVKENKHKVLGAIMTFCCHHRCTWTPFVGKEFFQENDFTKKDFEILCGIVSWATCGTGFSRERRNNIEKETDLKQSTVAKDDELGLSREQKEEIGRRSKNLINWGRLLYLQKMGFQCYLHYYTDKNVSLENVCIVAYTNK
ncbi:tRNA:m(4)X modification enzyme TRM13 homolog [Aethina tumida]|uniref:tRNA:m(4)X modification enzyme TRM13 homolog n=1 Tax=Aethina tumida TaxID=116153 RepID=UPI0021472CCA|nr:tRNA:m(4)X modification enzyme TRM13 homolog [Aethina tumida]